MKQVFLTICFLLATTVLLTATIVSAQEKKNKSQRPDITGDFQLEVGEKSKNKSVTSIDEAILFLENLSNSVKSLSQGNISKASDASSDALNYFSVAYLVCTAETGACPMYLESLLEADVINARIDKNTNAPCRNLKGFWRAYIDNDLENRMRFMSKLGLVSKMTDFNETQRPKFLKCKDTVKIETTGNLSDSEFFKFRYKDQARLEHINNSLSAVKDYKTKGVNIFSQISASGK
jgi:hypothetical protein